MDKKRWWIWGAVLCVVALALLVAVRGLSSPTDPSKLYYQATCAVIESSSVDGYVSNLSQDVYQVYGNARFTFTSTYSMAHPDILVQVNGIIPAGQTVRVARARLAFQLRPGESCAFDIKNGIRKL